MNTFASGRSGWRPFAVGAGLRGALAAAGVALFVAGCGQQAPNPTSAKVAPSAKPAASAAAAPASAPVPAPAGTSAASAAATQAQQAAATARAKLKSMDVPDLLGAARAAYAQHRLVAPAGDNAMEYYEEVLAKDPGNRVATDALRETFPFAVPDVEKAIASNDFDEAGRAIDVLTKADPTNYTLTLLRSKLDAQKRLQARQQQEQQAQAQKAVELAAAQKAAAAKAEADKQAEAARAAQAAALAKAAPPPPPTPTAPPKPEGETREAIPMSPVSPTYPVQAAREQISGYAVVEFTVDSDGSIENPHVIDSSPRRVFDNAAVQAVRRAKFQPAMRDGQAVSSIVRRRIDFKFGG